jgi:hypothetical protein
MQRESEYKPSESDVKSVMEAHDLLAEGPILDEALELTSLYADTIRQVLRKLPDSVNRGKAILAIIEEGLMEDGVIPNTHEKKFEMAFLEELLMREGIVHHRHKKKFEIPTEPGEGQ